MPEKFLMSALTAEVEKLRFPPENKTRETSRESTQNLQRLIGKKLGPDRFNGWIETSEFSDPSFLSLFFSKKISCF